MCNSVVAASSLGAKAFFSGKVADDSDGELYINDLQDAGVDFHVQVKSQASLASAW